MSCGTLENKARGTGIVAAKVGENLLVFGDEINRDLVPTHGIGQMVERLRVLVTTDSL